MNAPETAREPRTATDLLNSLGIAGPNIPHHHQTEPTPEWDADEMAVWEATKDTDWCVCGREWPCAALQLAEIVADHEAIEAEAAQGAGSGEARIADLEGALKALYSEINEFFSMNPDMDNPDFVPTGKVRMPGDWLRDIRVALDMEPGAGSGEAAGLREAVLALVDDLPRWDGGHGHGVVGIFECNWDMLRARVLALPAAPTGAASTGLDVERLAVAMDRVMPGLRGPTKVCEHHAYWPLGDEAGDQATAGDFAAAVFAEYERLAAPAPETAAADRPGEASE